MENMGREEISKIGDTSFNPKHAVAWLENEPQPSQLILVGDIFQRLIDNASRPKQSSGNSCTKLCGFFEHCSKSDQVVLRDFAFTEATALKLFDFFIEWNELDAHRTMRLVLDCLVHSISKNPVPEVGISVKARVLTASVAMITRSSSRPSTKSAMVALDHLLQKRIISPDEVLNTYQEIHDVSAKDATWDTFLAKVFAWMELQHVCPVAGKLLVTVFTLPWLEDGKEVRHHADAWHRFVYSGLQLNPDLLEPIQLYVFIPLFKVARSETFKYLHDLSTAQKLTGNHSQGWDLNAMLWLSLLEAGKKVGLIGEPGHVSTKPDAIAQIPADVLDDVLSHESREARSSGASILVASPSTTKPYTPEALDLLKKHIPSFYEDTDAKFRYDVLGHSRNMIKRIQSTIESLRKDLDRILKKAEKVAPLEKDSQLPTSTAQQDKKRAPQDDLISKLRETLGYHEEFICWFADFLKGELIPTASYQRHITALRATGFFLKSAITQAGGKSVNQWPANLVVDNTWFRAVLDLIMDPFDDVREEAACLVMLLQPAGAFSDPPSAIDGLQGHPKDELRDFYRKADELSRKTARADHSDGAARSSELVCRWNTEFEDVLAVPTTILANLEAKLTVAEQDLALAVLQSPVHGDYASLRYIWGSFSAKKYTPDQLERLDTLQDRAIESCQRIWRAVQHVLCDDSPEGHLPEEMQAVEGLDTKDLLSYSFRAIHESSNLLRAISNNARFSRDRGFLSPTADHFRAVGDLTFDQLSNLRHRGAFSTVAQTFTTSCQRVKSFPSLSGGSVSLLDNWYQGALACIYTQASTTRRSAGIPAIVVGILSARAEQPSFQDVVNKLQEIARQPAYTSETDGSNLPQVHALNCIKDVFKNSFLSSSAQPYLADCLELAANSLKSEVWAIRNCGLLLLRSLIDNLFGTHESKQAMEAGWDGRTVRIPYHKFKALPALLVSLLELGKQSSGVLIGSQTAESVFPALDIIRRAGPPEESRDKLYGIIAWYLGSRIWHVREIAARTLCSLLLKPDWNTSIQSLLWEACTSANKLHGALLTLRYLLERLVDVMPDQLSGENLGDLCAFLERLPSEAVSLLDCTETLAVYVEVINNLARLEPVGGTESSAYMSRISKLQEHWIYQGTELLDRRLAPDDAPRALLRTRLGEAVVQFISHGLNGSPTEELNQKLLLALETDANVACSMLEALSRQQLSQTKEAQTYLIDTYTQTCFATDTPEPRTLALENLASLMDILLKSNVEDSLSRLPSDETLAELWVDLHRKPMNPALSDAIIQVSGPIMATALLRAGGQVGSTLAQRLRAWGAMMSDALVAEQPLDTRIAAVQALTSVSRAAFLPSSSPAHHHHLPWLLALYDALSDDDDEVRAQAARDAAAPVLGGQALVPVEASARLLHRLTRWLGDSSSPAFQAHVAGRVVGHYFVGTPTSPASPSSREEEAEWTPAAAQLARAARFDAALFVVEEQNLYVDEVREAGRWASALSSSAPSNSNLRAWTLRGLQALADMAQQQQQTDDDDDDGPLGWTAKPAVFAICARVLLAAAALVKMGAGDGEEEEEEEVEVRAALARFVEVARARRVHGLLLRLCGDVVE